MRGRDLKRIVKSVCLDKGGEVRLLSLGRRTVKVCGVCLCPGVFVYHLLCDDLNHSTPALFGESYRSACVSTCEQNNPNTMLDSISAVPRCRWLPLLQIQVVVHLGSFILCLHMRLFDVGAWAATKGLHMEWRHTPFESMSSWCLYEVTECTVATRHGAYSNCNCGRDRQPSGSQLKVRQTTAFNIFTPDIPHIHGNMTLWAQKFIAVWKNSHPHKPQFICNSKINDRSQCHLVHTNKL